MRVTTALEGLSGIHGVEVDVPGGTVTVRFDPERMAPDLESVLERLRAKGYEPGEPAPARAVDPGH